MEIHLDPRGQYLIERQLRSGRYQSPEQVVVTALENLNQNEQSTASDEERQKAVQHMLEFAGKHGFTLGQELRIRDLIHEGHNY